MTPTGLASTADETPKGRILAAAAQQLRKHGLRRFTVVDVAASAGMTHPNVYRYFTSKVALVDALVANWLRPLEDRIDTVVSAADPVPDKLERMVSAIARAYRAARIEEPELFAAFAAATSAGRPVARKHRTRMRRAFERVIEEGIGTGIIGMRDRGKAQTLLVDASWRFIDPASVLAETDEGTSLDGRLERVLEAALQRLGRREI